MDQDIKSRPRYHPLIHDRLGRCHLLLSDSAQVPQEALADPQAFAGTETWLLAEGRFSSTLGMLQALRTRLAEEMIGLRLYAVGTEPFLWDVAAVARAAGMGAGEISLCHAGSLRRRVRCVHCNSLLEPVTSSLVVCSGCHVTLFVRDHFSARLSAFMGVIGDAELPGDLPEAEELYR